MSRVGVRSLHHHSRDPIAEVWRVLLSWRRSEARSRRAVRSQSGRASSRWLVCWERAAIPPTARSPPPANVIHVSNELMHVNLHALYMCEYSTLRVQHLVTTLGLVKVSQSAITQCRVCWWHAMKRVPPRYRRAGRRRVRAARGPA